jgi:3-oxoacyl-[acyl-carrier-protein] synthase-3
MARVTLDGVRFRGLASCVPKTVVSNLGLPRFEEVGAPTTRPQYRILNRRICYPWQCFSDLAFAATERLLDAVGWQREEMTRSSL